MNDQVPHATASLECPESSTNCEVTFEVRVFRDVNDGGLEVTGCSEPSCDGTAATCMHDCVHTPEALRLYEQELRKHQAELSVIGTNVIG